MKFLIFPFVFLVCAGCSPASKNDDRPVSTLVKGTVEGKEGKYILILPHLLDPRFHTEEHKVRITDGRFEHRVEADHLTRYSFLFLEELERGAWSHILFFPDAEEVEIAVSAWPGDEGIESPLFEIKGGPINREMIRHTEEVSKTYRPLTEPLYGTLDSLFRVGKYDSDAAKEILARLDENPSAADRVSLFDQLNKLRERKEHLSPEAAALELRLEEYDRQRNDAMYEYIGRNRNLYAYSLFANDLFFNASKADSDRVVHLAEQYARRYPAHPYTEYIGRVVKGMTVRPGNKFVDFTAPDLLGRPHTLSEEIAGQIAYIDLWASWCGPCRAKSKKIIPLYERYKDRGFTVVGVAREHNDTEALQKAIEKDAYRWLNLVELNDAVGIWHLYGTSNAAGKTVLVDKEGTIVAVDPTVEDVSEYLATHLSLE